MLLPEWYPQQGILMAWPDETTDWNHSLDDAQRCYQEIINEICKRSKVFLLYQELESLNGLQLKDDKNLVLIKAKYNDTWTRDYGPISCHQQNGQIQFHDFQFNGWGKKFKAEQDNGVNSLLLAQGLLSNMEQHPSFVLEGGSIETDGRGTLLSTSHCLLAPNRNQPWSLEEIEEYLARHLGIKHFLWLSHGFLAGDDTDSHIDTLARFCDEHTICYVSPPGEQDEHHDALTKMERQLQSFRKQDGSPFDLIKVPMAEPAYDEEGSRLPATYVNFLIMDYQVLVPTYGTATDHKALSQIAIAFPEKEVIGINCNALIKQHGSLHCITMQLPKQEIQK